MTYVNEGGQDARVHAHPCDRTCHWVPISKPLAFSVLHNGQLTQTLVQSHLRHGNAFGNTYVKWLCRTGEDGRLNLLNLFLLVLDIRGPPSRPDITMQVA